MEDEQELEFQSYGVLPSAARRVLESIGNGLEESFSAELTSTWSTNQTQNALPFWYFPQLFDLAFHSLVDWHMDHSPVLPAWVRSPAYPAEHQQGSSQPTLTVPPH